MISVIHQRTGLTKFLYEKLCKNSLIMKEDVNHFHGLQVNCRRVDHYFNLPYNNFKTLRTLQVTMNIVIEEG